MSDPGSGPGIDLGMEPLTRPYYDALGRGELVIQHCNGCGRDNMYPRHRCPFCYEADLGWVRASGTGVLHSFAVTRFGAPTGFESETPYALGVVKLAEGVQVLARLWPDEDSGWSAYGCDTPVRFRPASRDEIARRPVPWFAVVHR
ncbi:Zn-ribbon domain-containing OB-fold protein [Nonomuraea angiospora]